MRELSGRGPCPFRCRSPAWPPPRRPHAQAAAQAARAYSNNFNPYAKGSDVVPTIPVPVGTGMWIAGGNNNIVRNNHFWDNWRPRDDALRGAGLDGVRTCRRGQRAGRL